MRPLLYLDHAATTPIASPVRVAMQPYLTSEFGNPSSSHSLGRAARGAVDDARSRWSTLLGCARDEVCFTASATEANNLALKGLVWAQARGSRTPHLVISAAEHASVLECAKALGRYFGAAVTVLPVDGHGIVDPDELRRAITADTVLVSIMTANNEVGSLNPVVELAAIAREAGVPFHTDAVAGGCWLDPKPLSRAADLVSFSGHKMYGPKGVGVLKVARRIDLVPLAHGGGQELGLHSGTENVAQIVGAGEAAVLAGKRDASVAAGVAAMRDRFVEAILGELPGVRLTGHPRKRLPNHASFVFEGIDGKLLMEALAERSICVSSGSACSTGKLKPSHVLTAMGVSGALAQSSLRVTLGLDTTRDDVERASAAIVEIVTMVRGGNTAVVAA